MTSPATQNVKEAAERLIQSGETLGGVGSPYPTDKGTWLQDDEILVGEWVKSLTDPSPITPAALEACGFAHYHGSLELEIGKVSVVFVAGCLFVCDEHGDDVAIEHIKTMGSLKMLIAALSPKDNV